MQAAVDLSLTHDHHAVGQVDDFLHFGRNKNYAYPLLCQINNDVVNLPFCTDIDTSGRFIEDEHFGIHQQPLAQDQLLLIAAGQEVCHSGQ